MKYSHKTFIATFITASLLLLIPSCAGPNSSTPSFNLQLANNSLSIQQGETGTLELSLNKTGGFNAPVALSVENFPAGVTATFTPDTTTASSVLNLTVANSASPGESNVTIKGQAGTLEKVATLSLTITRIPDPTDTTPPTVVKTESTSAVTVEITFSEAVINATNPANFSIFPDLVVSAASVGIDGKTVTLTTATQTKDESYAVAVSSAVTDLAGNPYSPANDPPFATTFIGTGQISGELNVVVNGLPAGVLADVLVTGPASFSQTITASTTLTGLSSGSYQFQVKPVKPKSATFSDNGSPSTFSFDASTGGTVALSYSCSKVSPPDAVLDAEFKSRLGKESYTCADLAGLSTFNFNGFFGTEIRDLEGLQYAIGLTELVLTRHRISTIPAGLLDNMTALTKLDVRFNEMTSLAPGLFTQLTSLKILNLEDNEINAVPAGIFDSLTTLEELGLGDNVLTQLPAGIFDKLTALKTLTLFSSQLTKDAPLPAGVFDNLTSLTSLDLNDTGLSFLPAGIFDKLTSLTTLVLRNNCLQLAKVPTKGQLAKLTATITTVNTSENPRVGCPNVSQPAVRSNFDADTEGWTTIGDAINLVHVPSGGNPGGFIQATDGEQGLTWYWKAPDLYYGDARDYIGKTLKFSLKQSATDSQFDDVDIILRAACCVPLVAEITAPGTSFTDYEITLIPDNFSPPTTDNAFAQVLEDLVSIEIRGEYRTGPDTGGLDTVSFGD